MLFITRISYPTNIYDMNLNHINTLEKFSKVGLSDPSNSSLVKFAVALE